ncbi:rhodanese-like domain-containing protein [Hymenobacter gummosus]|uniref:Rhodanese-like domain-containing protein n=1 Tax=Hymenobacter gummosus TaxID=1776032 RepID=A0A431U7Y2_9BACT|nr:rhodanese-like domain-containing protein [Hymenobacter gummosus]RTQ52572.1 rhodanese-like domain-containing protein [Hymenobacter gummosus]
MKTKAATLLFGAVLLPFAAPAQAPKPVPADSVRLLLNSSGRFVTPVPLALSLRLAQQRGVVVIDVRSASEFRSGHVRGARNFPYESFDQFRPAVPRFKAKQLYLIYGSSASQSNEVGAVLGKLGKVYCLTAEPYAALLSAGVPTE